MTLDRLLEGTFELGLGVSGLLLLAGLLAGRPGLLWWGVMAVIATPVAGSVVIALQLIRERDWVYAGVAILILAVLASSAVAGIRLGRTAAPAPRASEPAPPAR